MLLSNKTFKHRQDHLSDKYSSLAISIKDTICILKKHYILAINALMFVVFNTVTNKQTSFLLLYRKNNSNLQHYTENLNYMLNTYVIDIVLGDFKINYFHENDVRLLKETMNSNDYVQIVQSATFVSAGTLLDHVYVKEFLYNKVEHEIVSVYYSDHEAIMINVNH